MPEKLKNRNQDTYWRAVWSKDWYWQKPWWVEGKPMPYIGVWRKNNVITLRTFGPLLLIGITLPKREA